MSSQWCISFPDAPIRTAARSALAHHARREREGGALCGPCPKGTAHPHFLWKPNERVRGFAPYATSVPHVSEKKNNNTKRHERGADWPQRLTAVFAPGPPHTRRCRPPLGPRPAPLPQRRARARAPPPPSRHVTRLAAALVYKLPAGTAHARKPHSFTTA